MNRLTDSELEALARFDDYGRICRETDAEDEDDDRGMEMLTTVMLAAVTVVALLAIFYVAAGFA